MKAHILEPLGIRVRRVGAEIAFGFGDCIFGIPAIKLISETHGCGVDVAVQAQCSDAFLNVPFINKTINVDNCWSGIGHFHDQRYDFAYQLTPYSKFNHYKSLDPSFSLLDCSKRLASELGIEVTDQRPLIYLSDQEKLAAANFLAKLSNGKPVVAIESHAKSGQSWADLTAVRKIIDYWKNKAHILWLSHTQAVEDTLGLANYTRREIIAMLCGIDHFYSVGSGFFCASLVEGLKPKHTTVMWIDESYKYTRRLSELGWNDDITWAHNIIELEAALHSYDGHY